MEPILHLDLEKKLQGSEPVLLELGCGLKKHPGRIGVDQKDYPGVDIVADLEEGLPFLPDNSVDAIHSKSFLEHIRNFEWMMSEIWRVLKPEGLNHAYVPHFSNPYFYSDYTHQRYFGLYSFEYFSKTQKHFRRRVPNYNQDFDFETQDMILIFSSPWLLRKIPNFFAQRLFNVSPGLQEFYEENLCYLIPCYALEVFQRPVK
jgi:predicted SAM-dependent methyltransferase